MREHSGIEAIAGATGTNWKPRASSWTTTANSPPPTDVDIAQMARTKFRDLEKRVADLEREVQIALLPPDENEERDAIVEIRAGTGGSEAAIFAADLYRMYNRYAEAAGLKIEDLESSPSELGGLKEVDFQSFGRNCFSQAALRKRRASRATRSRDRSTGPHPHFHRNGRGFAGSRGSRSRTKAGRSAD